MREFNKETDAHYVTAQIYEPDDEYLELIDDEWVDSTVTRYDVWLGCYGENKKDLGCTDICGQTRESLTLLRDALNELLAQESGA